MKIGIISDTHDNLPKIKRAVSLFNSKKVGYVLHAGDFVAPFVVPILEKLKCPWVGVFGNNDGEKRGLAEKSIGKIKEGPLELTLEGKRIYLAHSVNDEKEIIASEKYDLAIFGHAHKPQIKKENGVLVVNPGECGGWLYGKSTVAIVDLETLEAKVYRV